MSTPKERKFVYLNSRIHTRETSTLTFATVAFSASLLLLGLIIGMENPFNIVTLLSLYTIVNLQTSFYSLWYTSYITFQNSNDLLTIAGLIIIILGILYREVTIYTIENDDYNALKTEFKVELDKLSIRSRTTRAWTIRMFFATVLAVWVSYKLNLSLLIYLVILLVLALIIYDITKDC